MINEKINNPKARGKTPVVFIREKQLLYYTLWFSFHKPLVIFLPVSKRWVIQYNLEIGKS